MSSCSANGISRPFLLPFLSLSFSQNQNSENSFHPPFLSLSLSPRSKGVKAGPRRDILKQFLPTSLLFDSTLSLTLPTQPPFLLSKEEGEEERKTRFSIGNRRNRVFPRSAPILSNNRFLVKEWVSERVRERGREREREWNGLGGMGRRRPCINKTLRFLRTMYRCSVYIIFFDVDMWIGQICYSDSVYKSGEVLLRSSRTGGGGKNAQQRSLPKQRNVVRWTFVGQGTSPPSPRLSPSPASPVAQTDRPDSIDSRWGGEEEGGGRLSSLAAEKLTPVNFSKRGVHCFGTHVFSSSSLVETEREKERERDSVLYLLQLEILIIGIECLSFLWNLDYYSLIRISMNIDRKSEWLCINLLSKFEPIDWNISDGNTKILQKYLPTESGSIKSTNSR